MIKQIIRICEHKPEEAAKVIQGCGRYSVVWSEEDNRQIAIYRSNCIALNDMDAVVVNAAPVAAE